MMKLFLLFLFATSAYCTKQASRCDPSVSSASGTHAPSTLCSGELMFEETFNTLDYQKWQHENTLSGGGNWEFQWYSNNRSNSFVKDGNLHIRPSLLADQYGEGFLTSGVLNIEGGAPADRCTNPQFWGCERGGSPTNPINPLKSARLRTVQSFAFRYGRVEVRAKLPTGDWLWPAVWLMPAYNEYGGWPASGEIDLVESRGNRQLTSGGVNIGIEQAGSTLHYGPYPDLNGWPRAHWTRNNDAGYGSDFHRYQLEWTPDYLRFSIDDVLLGEIAPPEDGGFWTHGGFDEAAPNTENPWRFATKMAPFDQQFYIIMNLAVGGTNYFPDGASNPDPKPWSNDSPTATRDFYSARDRWLPTWGMDADEGESASLQVDYVRVWAL